MKLINKTKGVTVHENINIANTLEKKTRGLLDAINGDALFFETRWGIHTFGMQFPIDCAICDMSGVVRTIKKNITPKKIIFWNPKYNRVFELPTGACDRTNTEVGDALMMEE